MPEASVDEDDGPTTREDDIWRTRQVSSMQPEPEPESMQQ